MKTKQIVLLAATTFTAAVSFAQVNLGVTGNAGATVTKSVNAGAVTGAASNAAASATAAASKTVSVTTSKVADVKASTTAAAQSALSKTAQTGNEVKNGAKNAADVNANARVNAQASTHASQEGGANANNNSALFGTKADGSVNADAETIVGVNGKPLLEKGEEKITETKSTVDAKKDAAVAKTKEVKKETSSKLKSEAKNTLNESEAGGNAESKTDVKTETSGRVQKH